MNDFGYSETNQLYGMGKFFIVQNPKSGVTGKPEGENSWFSRWMYVVATDL